jgi:CDP-diacylglycerol--serine O-phosphatidyltransferase
MTPAKLRRPRRPKMRQAVVIFPSGLTLGNLFFGVFAIITASRGDIRLAGIYVLIGGILDAFDGRVARATNAGSAFGEELDSLVDAISFGLAPAMIMYFAVLNRDGWDWIFVFLFAAAAVMRLARFNIEQAGTAKTYFSGLPSPAAGCTLASYYWFSQSWLYNYGAIGNLPWTEMLRFLMAILAVLMLSPIPYPIFPRTGLRSVRAAAATLLLIVSLTLLLTKRLEYFFPLTLIYVAWGLGRWVFARLFERRQPTIPYDLSEGEDDEEEEDEEFEPGAASVQALRPAGRDVRPPREERPKRSRGREEPAAKPEPSEDRPPRADGGDRPERPRRTEAERAARRETREKRDAREGRPERTPRPPRTDVVPVGLDVAPMDESPYAPISPLTTGDVAEAAIVNDAPAAALAGLEGAPPRKRKRRRRRGERKERNPSDAGVSGDAGDSADAGATDGDDNFEDGPDEVDARPANVVMPPATSAGHFNTQAPSQPDQGGAPASAAAPVPPPSTEPHE